MTLLLLEGGLPGNNPTFPCASRRALDKLGGGRLTDGFMSEDPNVLGCQSVNKGPEDDESSANGARSHFPSASGDEFVPDRAYPDHTASTPPTLAPSLTSQHCLFLPMQKQAASLFDSAPMLSGYKTQALRSDWSLDEIVQEPRV